MCFCCLFWFQGDVSPYVCSLYFKSVWVAGATFWLIATRSVGHMLSLSFLYLYFFISHFGLKRGIWLLIVPVPIHCFSITFEELRLL